MVMPASAVVVRSGARCAVLANAFRPCALALPNIHQLDRLAAPRCSKFTDAFLAELAPNKRASLRLASVSGLPFMYESYAALYMARRGTDSEIYATADSRSNVVDW